MLYINISKAYTLKDGREKNYPIASKKRNLLLRINSPSSQGGCPGPEYFKDVFPASTMVEVKGLVNKDLMLEIEAVAVLEE